MISKHKPIKPPDPHIVTSNKKLLTDFVKFSNPNAEKEYDLKNAIDIFIFLVRTYNLEYRYEAKWLIFYIFAGLIGFDNLKSKDGVLFESMFEMILLVMKFYSSCFGIKFVSDIDFKGIKKALTIKHVKIVKDKKNWLNQGLRDYFSFFIDCTISSAKLSKDSTKEFATFCLLAKKMGGPSNEKLDVFSELKNIFSDIDFD